MSFDFDLPSILIGMFFSLVGFGAWRYGRNIQSGRHMILGALLMGFGYFIPNPYTGFGIGALLTILLFWP